jgi:hypothetical protein
MYVAGWPTVLPTRDEAQLIADVRTKISRLLNLDSMCLTADSVLARYEELLRKNGHAQGESAVLCAA